MDEIQAEAIAERIAARLRDSHVIPAALPAYIGTAIREATAHGIRQWVNTIPLAGPACVVTYWTLLADGGMHLELRDSSGQTFWQGTLRPAGGKGSA